jgi:LysM repeat protein
VQPGETVYSIAELYGVSAGGLTIVNNLADPNLLSVGQSLAIPPPPCLPLPV